MDESTKEQLKMVVRLSVHEVFLLYTQTLVSEVRVGKNPRAATSP